MVVKIKHFLALIFFGIINTNSFAQTIDSDSLLKMDLEQLLDIVVLTSTQTDIAINKAPSNIYSFTGNELRHYGIRNLSELLSFLLPGVINTEDGDESISAFRGVATDNNTKILTLINGHKINPQWAKGATPELELGFLEDIDKVEVIIGPGSALYGSGATIGVINIITKNAADGNSFSAFTSYGTGNYIQADISSAMKINKDLSVSTSAGILKSDGYPRRDGSANNNWPLYIDRNPLSLRLMVDVKYKKTDIQSRYTSFGRSLYNTVANPLKANPYELWDYFFVEARHNIKLNEKLNILLTGSYDAHQTRRFDLLNGYKIRAIGESHIGGTVRTVWTPSLNTSIIGGVEYFNDSFGNDWSGDNFNISPTLDTINNTLSFNPKYSDRIITPYNRNTYGVYAQFTHDFGKKASIIGGIRYDYIFAPNVDINSAITPRVGIVYSPFPKLVTKVLFTSGFRQAMAVLNSPDNYLLGNAIHYSEITKPEKIYSTELSISYLLNPYINITINSFYNRFYNLHSLAPSDTSGVHKNGLHFVSAGEVDFIGFESTIWCKIANRLTARVIHQFVKPGKIKDDPFGVFIKSADELMFYPKNVSKALLDIQFFDFLSANTNIEVIYNNFGYDKNSQLAESGLYTLFNANLIFKFGKNARNEFIISGYNLLNVSPLIPMPTAPGTGTNMVPIPGRNFNISYRFNI